MYSLEVDDARVVTIQTDAGEEGKTSCLYRFQAAGVTETTAHPRTQEIEKSNLGMMACRISNLARKTETAKGRKGNSWAIDGVTG